MKIVTEYQDKLNIRCVRSPENQGCGGARQVGIETVGCSDDYITFLDADDALLPQAVHLLNEAATTQADVLCSPFLILDPGAKKTRPFRFYRGGCGVFMTHGKAYRTKFIKENGIYSDKEIRYFFNDYFLNHQVFNYTTNIHYIYEYFYIYTKTSGSTTMQPELRYKEMPVMRKLSYKLLHNIFTLKGIKKEQLYYENEKQMCNLFQQLATKYIK